MNYSYYRWCWCHPWSYTTADKEASNLMRHVVLSLHFIAMLLAYYLPDPVSLLPEENRRQLRRRRLSDDTSASIYTNVTCTSGGDLRTDASETAPQPAVGPEDPPSYSEQPVLSACSGTVAIDPNIHNQVASGSIEDEEYSVNIAARSFGSGVSSSEGSPSTSSCSITISDHRTTATSENPSNASDVLETPSILPSSSSCASKTEIGTSAAPLLERFNSSVTDISINPDNDLDVASDHEQQTSSSVS
ncbi:unnamed protein product [Protopolystoma xenopodis]|uniref:Uncharacterized protein n=1 Tax=Protopolystoma xenopodis TaxID=117903 RepID=A0A448WMX0_9PLAT|nr:unnamed protein product [Protopolystoma xenopodis]